MMMMKDTMILYVIGCVRVLRVRARHRLRTICEILAELSELSLPRRADKEQHARSPL